MKCLLYAQLSNGKQITDIDPDYFIKMRHYARIKDWDIIKFLSDESISTDRVEKSQLKNLRKFLNERKDLEAIILAVSRDITNAEFAAWKMIEKKGIRLIIWSSRTQRQK